jgi:threonine synthase
VSGFRFSFVTAMRCVTCGREEAFDALPPTCPTCGPIAGTMDVLYDVDAARAELTPDRLRERGDPTIWRYREILPIRNPWVIAPLPVGMTPLYPLDKSFGIRSPFGLRLLIKDETRNPSASAKDRASAVAVARAHEIEAEVIAAASTGNAASSVAMLAASARIPCVIFVPADAPPAKLAQIQAHGAVLFAVEGTYDEAFDLCSAACDAFGWYNRNTAVNPVLGEGKKTIALEVWEQLGFRAPDAMVVPVGDGCVIGGIAKGWRDLLDLGLVDRSPRLIGVQAEGSAALARAWEEGRPRCERVAAYTIADSISVSMPRDQVKALRAVRETNGGLVTVSDEAILEALGLLARRAGILVEPASAAAVAGMIPALERGLIDERDEVVLVLTGHGLKDIGSVRRASAGNEPIRIRPEIGAVERALARRGGERWRS